MWSTTLNSYLAQSVPVSGRKAYMTLWMAAAALSGSGLRDDEYVRRRPTLGERRELRGELTALRHRPLRPGTGDAAGVLTSSVDTAGVETSSSFSSSFLVSSSLSSSSFSSCTTALSSALSSSSSSPSGSSVSLSDSESAAFCAAVARLRMERIHASLAPSESATKGYSTPSSSHVTTVNAPGAGAELSVAAAPGSAAAAAQSTTSTMSLASIHAMLDGDSSSAKT